MKLILESGRHDVECYIFDVQEQHEKQLLRQLRDFAWLVPTWCTRIDISCVGSDLGDNAASVACYLQYGRAKMSLTNKHFASSDEQQRRNISHEFIHLIVEPLAAEAEAIVENLVAHELSDYTASKLREQTERCVAGFEDALARKGAPA